MEHLKSALAIIAIIFVISGAIFKIMHYKFANEILIIGFVLNPLVYFMEWNKKQKNNKE